MTSTHVFLVKVAFFVSTQVCEICRFPAKHCFREGRDNKQDNIYRKSQWAVKWANLPKRGFVLHLATFCGRSSLVSLS